MTEFERPTCHICGEKIEKNHSHIGPPFESQTRHMRCVAKCVKCGKENITDLTGHRSICTGENIEFHRELLKLHLTGKPE